MFKKLLLASLITLSTLLADAQSVNFLGVGKRETKKILNEYGFTTKVDNPVFSRITAISAYNEDARAFGLYIFINRKCVEFTYAIVDMDEYQWAETLDASLIPIMEYVWADIDNGHLYKLYFDETLEEWAVYVITM